MADAASSLALINAQLTQKDVKAVIPKNVKEVHAAAMKFESLFMNEMLSHMNEGQQADGEFDGGHGEDVFRSMLTEQYGKIVADSGQTGLSKQIEKEMLRMQEAQANPKGGAQPIGLITGKNTGLTPSAVTQSQAGAEAQASGTNNAI